MRESTSVLPHDLDTQVRLSRRVSRDRRAVAVFVLVALVTAGYFEAFERFAALAERYERYQVDEIVSLLAILPVALTVYIARRHHDLRVELTGRMALQEELAWSADHDLLTGLPNRRLLSRRLAAATDPAVSGRLTGILLLNLDHFKQINVTLGHHAGDDLVREIGLRLVGAVRAQDTVAHIGGDEFAVLLTDLVSVEEAMAVATCLQDCLDTAVELGELSLPVEASLGVAVAPIDAVDADLLMRRADMAMHEAKSLQSRIARYRPEADQSGPVRLTLVSELRAALDRDELVLHFQPKSNLATQRVTVVEALVRWAHPRRGLLSPDHFLAVAERTGLIRPLTLRVLDLALAAVKNWRDDGRDLTVAVNLSARNLLDLSLPHEVGEALARHGLTASVLELEITESIAMADPTRALRVLTELRDRGVLLAIDDYGTGHSSLAYLQRLPVRQLKIDRSFVTTMTTDQANAVIVRSTVELARHLGLDVVAEGVEDLGTLRALAGLGCHSAQGYCLGRPAPAGAILALIRETETTLHDALRPRDSAAPDPAPTAPTAVIPSIQRSAGPPATDGPSPEPPPATLGDCSAGTHASRVPLQVGHDTGRDCRVAPGQEVPAALGLVGLVDPFHGEGERAQAPQETPVGPSATDLATSTPST